MKLFKLFVRLSAVAFIGESLFEQFFFYCSFITLFCCLLVLGVCLMCRHIALHLNMKYYSIAYASLVCVCMWLMFITYYDHHFMSFYSPKNVFNKKKTRSAQLSYKRNRTEKCFSLQLFWSINGNQRRQAEREEKPNHIWNSFVWYKTNEKIAFRLLPKPKNLC